MNAAISFLFGICIGSFLNVCIYRLPRGESVVAPRSHCPGCGRLIAAYDNIPLLSYLILRGRCRQCGARISPQYFLVELATGLLFVLCYSIYGPTAEFLKYSVFAALLLVLTVTDWRERILPDMVTYPGLAMGLVFALFIQVGDGAGAWLMRAAGVPRVSPLAVSLADALLGLLAGGGFLYLIGELYLRLRGREGMGFGDVKMMAMVGCFLGPRLTLLTILLASLGGSVLGLLFIVLYRKGSDYQLPFGTFLGAAAFVVALWGWGILRWYAAMFP